MTRFSFIKYRWLVCAFVIVHCGIMDPTVKQSEDSVTSKDPSTPSTTKPTSPIVPDKPLGTLVVTFTDVKAILDKQCSSCHSDKSTFITPTTYSNLIDKKYVIPGSSATSYLYLKGTGKTPTHNDQPGFDPLHTVEGDADKVKIWIDAGAPKN